MWCTAQGTRDDQKVGLVDSIGTLWYVNWFSFIIQGNPSVFTDVRYSFDELNIKRIEYTFGRICEIKYTFRIPLLE